MAKKHAHGSPWDRGSADSWYARPREPHWYPKGTYNGRCIPESEMSKQEIADYHAGYDANEEEGGKKDWG